MLLLPGATVPGSHRSQVLLSLDGFVPSPQTAHCALPDDATHPSSHGSHSWFVPAFE